MFSSFFSPSTTMFLLFLPFSASSSAIEPSNMRRGMSHTSSHITDGLWCCPLCGMVICIPFSRGTDVAGAHNCHHHHPTDKSCGIHSL
ncbi:hypothetical protein FIBSPDRAFT_255867 [Athelia psychrophila]|uniref:Secreted protein n=1 Tax=Athelia psychrophila TaxID=1759441 RepID=A0A165XM30_9AGAM|nr:hypothetical protein FIBSPDRAFT_255867 [Fibularhizoctonia sp. CBS 109695]